MYSNTQTQYVTNLYTVNSRCLRANVGRVNVRNASQLGQTTRIVDVRENRLYVKDTREVRVGMTNNRST